MCSISERRVDSSYPGGEKILKKKVSISSAESNINRRNIFFKRSLLLIKRLLIMLLGFF